MPQISVVVTAHNNAGLLARCLASVVESRCRDFELIVVDDASTDEAVMTAKRFTDKVIAFECHRGTNAARVAGYTLAKGDLIINLDADVVVFPDTFKKVIASFAAHPEAVAVTGILSKQHPFQNFSSQYKNLYMHFIFIRLPERVTFLYGSLYGFRREIANEYVSNIRGAEDTMFGQRLCSLGKKIYLDKTLEVEHLKHYDLLKLIRNDFNIPFHWACIFLEYNGIRQMVKGGGGFAHASLRQLTGIGFAAIVVLLIVAQILGSPVLPYLLAGAVAWVLLNEDFFVFLKKEKGAWFAARSIAFTFLDQIVMLSGIISGLIHFSMRRSNSKAP